MLPIVILSEHRIRRVYGRSRRLLFQTWGRSAYRSTYPDADCTSHHPTHSVPSNRAPSNGKPGHIRANFVPIHREPDPTSDHKSVHYSTDAAMRLRLAVASAREADIVDVGMQCVLLDKSVLVAGFGSVRASSRFWRRLPTRHV